MITHRRTRAAVLFLGAALLFSGPVLAADEEIGWASVAELSLVVTDGNSENTTFGFGDTTTRTWENALLTLKAGGIRAESTQFSRVAVGTPMSFVVNETKSTRLDTERYWLSGRYDRNITERFFWFGSAGWLRNRPSGVENRYTAAAGVGNVLIDGDKVVLKTNYGLTFTDEDDVDGAPGADSSYLGAGAGWEFKYKFSENATYGNDLSVNAALEGDSDVLVAMDNSLSASLTQRLAVKIGLRFDYDSAPALVRINLEDGMNNVIGTVFVEREDLDTTLTTSLVINF